MISEKHSFTLYLGVFDWSLIRFLFKVNYLVYNNQTILEQSAWCSIPFNEEPSGSVYMMLTSTMIYFFAPMIIVTMLYTK